MISWLLSAALAHPLAPAALEVDVLDDRTAELRWRTPTTRPAGVRLEPRLDGPCRPVDPASASVEDGWQVVRRGWRCPDLGAAEVVVDGLDAAPVDVVLTVRAPDGREARRLLTAGRPRIPLIEPAPSGASFFGAGVRHLLAGLDHVLLVVGLAVLLGPGRRLVRALTAFTVGHSLTLGLVALTGGGPAALVEIAIALSLVWLALELLAQEDGSPGLLSRRPGGIGLLIGLLHGAGFGGALSGLGLPRDAVLGAVLLFNLGIEAAQLGVVAVLGVVAAVVPWRPGRVVVAYLVGSLAMAWTIQRVAALW